MYVTKWDETGLYYSRDRAICPLQGIREKKHESRRSENMNGVVWNELKLRMEERLMGGWGGKVKRDVCDSKMGEVGCRREGGVTGQRR